MKFFCEIAVFVLIFLSNQRNLTRKIVLKKVDVFASKITDLPTLYNPASVRLSSTRKKAENKNNGKIMNTIGNVQF